MKGNFFRAAEISVDSKFFHIKSDCSTTLSYKISNISGSTQHKIQFEILSFTHVMLQK